MFKSQLFGTFLNKNFSKLNPKTLGYVCPNGNIVFQSEEVASRYAKNKVVKKLCETGKEYGVAVEGRTVVGEVDGTTNSVNLREMECITSRFNPSANLERNLVLYHSHPESSPGITPPLSFVGGDIDTAVNAKLKSIVACNKYGECNAVEITDNFSLERFSALKSKLDEFFISKVLTPNEFQIFKKIQALVNTPEGIPKYLQNTWAKQLEEKLSRSQEYIGSHSANLFHEFYSKYMADCGIKYSTNFRNLTNKS